MKTCVALVCFILSQKDFHVFYRTLLAIHIELRQQYRYAEDVVYYLIAVFADLLKLALMLMILPVMAVTAPIRYFGKRILFLCCNVQLHSRKRKDGKNMTTTEKISEFVDTLMLRIYNVLQYIYRKYKAVVKYINRTQLMMNLRVKVYRAKTAIYNFVTCAPPAPSGPRTRVGRSKSILKHSESSAGIAKGGSTGTWREDLKMTSRERNIRRLYIKLNHELDTLKLEFVTDHNLAISIFDNVIDTAGAFLLICQYKLNRLRFSMVLVAEMVIYAGVAAFMAYYTTWVTRAITIASINIGFLFITYAVRPYTEHADRWVEWLGRVMVVIVVGGVIYYHQNGPSTMIEQENVHFLTPFVTIRSFIDEVLTSGLTPFMILDIVITAIVVLYIFNVLNHIGMFRSLQRYIHTLRYAMHDHVVDFLIAKADERALGVENMHTGMLMVQQWNDVIREQRRYGLIPMPDVRPPTLLTFKEKMIEIKWASLFNLTIENIRTSLGLSLLHIVMCSADPEITKWIIHNHPSLLLTQDFQRDTPVAIALKECAHYLILFSNMNNGLLDDGTSFGDDEFNTYYPEALDFRESVQYNGEFNTEVAEFYDLTAHDRDMLKEYMYFVEKKDPKEKRDRFRPARVEASMSTAKSSHKKPKKHAIKNSSSRLRLTEAALPKGRHNRQSSQGSVNQNVTNVKRFPEDDLDDDYEGGQATGWRLLNIVIPDNNIDQEDYEDAFSDDDLKYGVKDSELDAVVDRMAIPSNHEHLRKLEENINIFDDSSVGFDMLQVKMNSSKAKKSSGVQELTSRSHAHDQEIRWKLCKFAEILLSQQIYAHCQNMEWNVAAYKEFNKMASVKQGLLAQSLAVCYNLNPPDGFIRFSDWTAGKVETINEEYNELEEMNKIGKTISAFTKSFKTVSNLLLRTKQDINEDAFNDRIITYLSECYASSRTIVDLRDSELSTSARIAWRAIARALRKRNCTYVIPSLFTSPQQIILHKLYLQRNELDDGDAVMVADVIINQQSVRYVDVSYNRIGSRGMSRLCSSMKDHKSIVTFRIDYNRIGPVCSKDVGAWLKQSKTLQVVSMSHNRLGEIVRYPTSSNRELIKGAARDIFFGLKSNKALQMFDISYNSLGPDVARVVPNSVSRHPTLFSLNIAGNDIGEKGAGMIYALAGTSDHQQKRRRGGGGSDTASTTSGAITATTSQSGSMSSRTGGSTATGSSKSTTRRKGAILADLNLSDNQLGPEAGGAISTLLRKTKTLTSLDISNNSLGLDGCRAIMVGMYEAYGLLDRDLDIREREFKEKMREKYKQIDKLGAPLAEESMTLTGDDTNRRKRRRIYLKLVHFNISRNGCGPGSISTLMNIIASENCTLTNLDISYNPVGIGSAKAGSAIQCGLDLRSGIGANKTLKCLNCNRIALMPTQILPIFGGVANSTSLVEINVNNMEFDEPCCLQLSTAIEACPSLEVVCIMNASMGPKGGALVTLNIERALHRIRVLDFTNSQLGYAAVLPLVRCLSHEETALTTLRLAGNDLDEDGGCAIAIALRNNNTLTELDLSNNHLNYPVALRLNESTRPLILAGRASSSCKLKTLKINDNPAIGGKGARLILLGLATSWTEHIEMRNINAGPSCAYEVSKALRKVTVTWKYLDFSGNYFSRVGINQICWSLRQNRRVRVLRLSDNKAGLKMGSNDDTLGRHGIGLVRAIRENLILRELDLSYCGLGSEAGINIFNVMRENTSIRKLVLRGNAFDDDVSEAFGYMLTDNDVLTELDVGDNKYGYNFCFSLAEGLEENRSIVHLIVDKCEITVAGAATLEAITQALTMNITLRYLNLDGNRLGSEWGVGIAEAISKNSTLTHVSLRNNRLDSRAGEALYRAYIHNYHVVEIGLSSEEVGLDIFEKFQAAFCRKRCPQQMMDVQYETSIQRFTENDPGLMYE